MENLPTQLRHFRPTKFVMLLTLAGCGLATYVAIRQEQQLFSPSSVFQKENVNQTLVQTLELVASATPTPTATQSPAPIQTTAVVIDPVTQPEKNANVESPISVEPLDCPAKELGLTWLIGDDEGGGPCGKEELQAYRNRTYKSSPEAALTSTVPTSLFPSPNLTHEMTTNKILKDFHFFGLGVQKGGTTTLFQRISSHPESFIGVKEMRYFLNQNVDEMDPTEAKLEFFNIHWWEVKEVDPGLRRGEITPEYMAQPLVAPRVHRIMGGPLRFIVMLREPVARAYSFYQMHKRAGNKKKKIKETFDLTIEREYALLQDCMEGATKAPSMPTTGAGGTGPKEDGRAESGNITEGEGKGGGHGNGGEGKLTGGSRYALEEFEAHRGEGGNANWYRDCYLPRYSSEGSAKPGSGGIGPLGYGFYFLQLQYWFKVYPPCSFMFLDMSELNMPGVDVCLWKFLDVHQLDFKVPEEEKDFKGENGDWMQEQIYRTDDPINKDTVAKLKKMYYPFVKKLEKLIGKELPSWGY